MDRNSIIGFLLIIGLVVTYMLYNQHAQTQYQEQKRADSVAYAKLHPRPFVDSSKAVKEIAAVDSVADSTHKNLPTAFAGKAQTVVLENKKLSLTFSSKGAYPVAAEVKGYKTYSQKPLYLFNGDSNQLYTILPVNNGTISTADLYFIPVVKDEPNGDKSIDFSADLGSGKKVVITYTLSADDYIMKYSMHLTGMPTSNLMMGWQVKGLHTEKDVISERPYCQVYYRYKNGDNDYFTIKSEDRKTLKDNAVNWVGFRKQYFSTILINNDGFSKADLQSSNQKDTSVAAMVSGTFEVPLSPSNDENVKLSWYIGPNDYRVLNSYKMGFEEMVPMGNGLMAFVKYINRWILVPIFYFLGSFISNYGIIIILMTVFIRLILSFFTYKSYLSAAKMRVLKPELDELRAKVGDDQQKFGVEQMKLFKSAGVSPLGGCLPTLFQIPILFSMYYMFPNFLEFRQKHFLWANDLSTYDNVLNLPFSIPLYGDHVSLFTLLMTATSLWLSLYSRNMTPQDPNNPVMKYMPFIFPIVLMGAFNKMAAALTCYYTFSNILSLSMQFVIQKYFIDEKAIHRQIQENKNKPATPSKWAARLEEMQKGQQQRLKKP